MGSCTPTAQINHLLKEYKAHLRPFVIEWPEPSRCALNHLNENLVSQDARSRNHKPVQFAAFIKGKEYSEGLPSYTPRPGPFPAQIGSPPSVAYCAYEIHDDIEYNPDSPKLENARVQVPMALPAQASHNARYGNGGRVIDAVPGLQGLFVDKDNLRTSVLLSGTGLDHGDPSGAYLIQSAPANIQSFDPPPWTGNYGFVSAGKSGQRSFTQDTYNPQAFGHAPHQTTGYFGASAVNDQMPRNWYGLQSFAGSANNSTSANHSSPVSPPFADHAPVRRRHPSCPLPPQDVVPRSGSFGQSNVYIRGSSPRTSSNSPPGVNTDATNESEIMRMGTQSQHHHHSSTSPQVGSGVIHSSSGKSHGNPLYPQSKLSTDQEDRIVPLGFNRPEHGIPAPTFATAGNFTQSYQKAIRGRDPALEANFMEDMHNSMQRATPFAGSPSVAPHVTSGQDFPPGNEYRMQSLSFNGPKSNQTAKPRGARSQKPNMRTITQQPSTWNPQAVQAPQSQVLRNATVPPFSGQFSPPKPRRKGQSAATVLDRYSRGGLVQGPTGGGYLHLNSGFAPTQYRQVAGQEISPGVGMAGAASSQTPSLFNKVSEKLPKEDIRSPNPSTGRQSHAPAVKGRAHSSRTLDPQMVASMGYRALAPAPSPAIVQDSTSNVVLGPQPALNSVPRFDNTEGYKSTHARYHNNVDSSQPSNPQIRGHSGANSKLVDYLQGRNPGMLLSDYIKPDKTQHHQRTKVKAPSDASPDSPSPSPADSNFSDDFILHGDESSKRRKKKGKAKRKAPTRGAAKATDAVKPATAQENAKKELELATARDARAERRSSGKINNGKEAENGQAGENRKAKEAKIEGDVTMNEG